MRFSTAIIVLAPAFVPSVLGDCQQGYQRFCKWYGSFPGCGESRFSEGDWDGAEQLTASTKSYSLRNLLDYNMITPDCYSDYGQGCVTGYKRLWCKSTHYMVDAGSDHSAQLPEFADDAAPKHPHQKQFVNIQIEI